jgi:hypothetical protein
LDLIIIYLTLTYEILVACIGYNTSMTITPDATACAGAVFVAEKCVEGRNLG